MSHTGVGTVPGISADNGSRGHAWYKTASGWRKKRTKLSACTLYTPRQQCARGLSCGRHGVHGETSDIRSRIIVGSPEFSSSSANLIVEGIEISSQLEGRPESRGREGAEIGWQPYTHLTASRNDRTSDLPTVVVSLSRSSRVHAKKSLSLLRMWPTERDDSDEVIHDGR